MTKKASSKYELTVEFKTFDTTNKDILSDILAQTSEKIKKPLEVKRVTFIIGLKEV
jgi:hypothetical protein